MLDRSGTMRAAVNRCLSSNAAGSTQRHSVHIQSGSGLDTPVSHHQQHHMGIKALHSEFDFDSVMRLESADVPSSREPFLEEESFLKRADTFSNRVEDLGVREMAYVAMLREELWQAAVTHVGTVDRRRLLAAMNCLEQIEWFWGAEGIDQVNTLRSLVLDGKWDDAGTLASNVTASMSSRTGDHTPPFFYVLVTVPPTGFRKTDFHLNLSAELSLVSRNEKQSFGNSELNYKIVEVDSARRALQAMIVNPDILAVVLQDNVPIESASARATLKGFEAFVRGMDKFVDEPIQKMKAGAPVLPTLIRTIHHCRRNLDIFCVGSTLGICSLENSLHLVKRMFFRQDDHSDLHEAILSGVRDKQKTPFFDSLRHYAERPIGVFHALAVSRGNSVRRSRWIQGLIDFYGVNLFKAESSATCGGLDSLLDPHGSLLEAQRMAARAYGASYAFFVTNGTSTSNKIVIQAILSPGDVVLVDRDCHKSHHYGFVLSGARPCYVDAYPLHSFSMYGGVPTIDIKRTLLEYRNCGRLDEVKALVVTNCTFDGLVYNVKRLVEECLAIKHDLIFLFDEAWFSYASFHPVLKSRTAMSVANEMRRLKLEGKYHVQFVELLEKLGVTDLAEATDEQLLDNQLYPDPRLMRLRIYATQSTHKSLTSLRQGSMILVNDDLFESNVHTAFKEAYYTHMSTSPNYQILATLDVGRAQMELEGYGLVERQIEAALLIRRSLGQDAMVQRYFDVLDTQDMIPKPHRTSSSQELERGRDMNIENLEHVWMSSDEFVLDPTRITLCTGRSGIDGDTFKVKWLMDKYGIQINKTSRNSVLFMTNIGTTRSSCFFLKACIKRCAQELELYHSMMSSREKEEFKEAIRNLMYDCPSLPNFSYFHPAFTSQNSEEQNKLVRDGDVRAAFYLAYDETAAEYFDLPSAIEAVEGGRILVATTFVIPYPPGFPILVPGQVVSHEVLIFIQKLDVKEIHGFDSKLGLRCFKESVLESFAARPIIDAAWKRQFKGNSFMSEQSDATTATAGVRDTANKASPATIIATAAPHGKLNLTTMSPTTSKTK